MPDLDINFQFTASAQSLQANNQLVKKTTDGFARLIVDEVALLNSRFLYQKARASLVAGVRQAIMSEVSKMAMSIGRFFILPERARGPQGQMSIHGGMATTAKRLGFQRTYFRESSGIKWDPRGRDYLRRKKSSHGHGRWWDYDGDLADDLNSKTGEFYSGIFGPIRVQFIPPKVTRDKKGRFQPGGFGKILPGNANLPQGRGFQKQTANGGVNITHHGGAGRFAQDYEVGKLEVQTFGKITPRMLPALATPDWDPKNAKPTQGDGVAGLFPNDGEGGTRNKLLGRQAAKRYALEPFVAFYLTRAIPNAVWRRTEKLVTEGAFA